MRGPAAVRDPLESRVGNNDVYVARIDGSGNWLWVETGGGAGLDDGADVCLDASGNLCIAGLFHQTATFGATSLSSAGATTSDIFVAKMGSSGNWIWAVRAGGTSYDNATSIASGPGGEIYVTGGFRTSAQFGSAILASLGGNDIYVARLDSGGTWLWATRTGSTGADLGKWIQPDSDGNVFLTGYFSSTAAFGADTLVSSGVTDIFVSQLDSAGNWVWTVSAGADEYDYGVALCPDNQGNIYLTGSYSNAVPFGATVLPGYGNYDIYAAKLALPEPIPVPRAPENLRVQIWGDDVRLLWDPVSQDTAGQPLYPDAYNIYLSTTGPGGEFLLNNQVLAGGNCEYIFYGWAQWLTPAFFRVTAVDNP